MFDFPEFFLLLLVVGVVWWFVRQGRRVSQDRARRAASHRREGARRKIDPSDAEDLVACSVCGAYVASGAPQCRRPDCPRPR